MQTQLSRIETYGKAKKPKRIPLAAAGLLTVTLAAGQVYAAANGTNLVDWVKQMLSKSETAATAKTTADLSGMEKPYTDQVNSVVDTKSAAATSEIAAHQQSEIDRANRELTNYVAQKDQELDTEMTPQKNAIKQGITNQVNTGIQSLKHIIDLAMENRLKTK